MDQSNKKRVRTLTALQPNAGIRAQYKKQIKALLKEMNDSFLYWLLSEYKKQENKIVQDSATDDIFKRHKELSKRWRTRWDKETNKFVLRFIEKSQKDAKFRITRRFKNVGISVDIKNNSRVTAVTKALINDNVNLIKTISSNYLDQVFGIVMRGVANGANVNFIKREILKRYDISERRANFIANDQSFKANQAIQRSYDEQLGIKKGVWVHRGGLKTSRYTHYKMNGKEFDLTGDNKGLYDSDVDRNVMPAELYGCRCTYHPVLPDNLK